ncbi:metalloprotease family protein [Streptococcus jiangjianxini]|uniref:metalloprotease family protein n=1 Tax=Streptococcus jiangjianxini TaxID=3161189 RepID=UPI0032EE38E6
MVHEGIHYLIAYCLGLSPKVKASLRSPSIVYKSTGNNINNILVFGIAPTTLIILGMFIIGRYLSSSFYFLLISIQGARRS